MTTTETKSLIGNYLVQQKKITQQQLENAICVYEKQDSYSRKPLGHILLELHLVVPNDLMEAMRATKHLSKSYREPLANLKKAQRQIENALENILIEFINQLKDKGATQIMYRMPSDLLNNNSENEEDYICFLFMLDNKYVCLRQYIHNDVQINLDKASNVNSCPYSLGDFKTIFEDENGFRLTPLV